MRSSKRAALIGCIGLAAFGCASDDGDGEAVNDVGSAAVGGAAVSQSGGSGGAATTGGAAAPTGGTSATATGGAAAGVGAATGGAAAATGGMEAATGGMEAATGGMEAATGGMQAATGGMQAATGGTAAPTGDGTCLQGTGDFGEDGPYGVETIEVTIGSSGDFTIFVPDPLEEDCPHPMVAWGNGTTVPGGTAYDHFNARMATWGIIAIASHDDGTGSPRIGDGSFHRAAIDYLLEENENSSSQFYGKVSGRAGVSGHSQGGAGGDRASAHENVEANGNVQGSFGGAPDGVAFLCLTGTEDIATESCLSAVNATSSPAMYASYDGMTHNETVSSRSEGSQEYARLLSAWFRCFLADDTAACAMFEGGADCPICQEPGWDEIFVVNY